MSNLNGQTIRLREPHGAGGERPGAYRVLRDGGRSLRVQPLAGGEAFFANRLDVIKAPTAETCGICGRSLLHHADPLAAAEPERVDCGGDCQQCMADAGDPDAIRALA
jgi:hypothetical protein